MKHSVAKAHGKSPCFKGFFLLLPFLFVLVAIVCAVVLLFENLVLTSGIYRALVDVNLVDADAGVTVPAGPLEDVTPDLGHLPAIPYESQWATLTVEGWEETEIPVYFGDSKAILKKGAGMWFNSRFCGQKGKTVLSAHVTSHFYEIEDTAIGTKVNVSAFYGDYVYEVTDVVIFKYTDNTVISPDKEETEDTLVMYTCYPRKNGYRFKTERMALICKKVSGEEWATYA